MSVEDFVIQITNEAILITILASMPTIAVSLIVGLLVALFSATTQIQEQTLSFVPKMIAVFVVIAATGPWVATMMLRFAARCIGGFLEVVH